MLEKIFKKKIHPVILLDYYPRMLAGAAVLSICASVFYPRNETTLVWTCLFLQTLLWPQLMLLISCLSRDPKKTELVALMFDSFFSGCWIGVMQFSPWPAVTLLVSSSCGSMSVRGIIPYFCGIILLVIGSLITGYFYHYTFNIHASNLTVCLSALSLLCFNTATAYIGYSRAISLKKTQYKLNDQKVKLENLSGQLSHYLSPQIYEAIFVLNKEVKIEASRKRLTIFFSDIAGFTDLTDRIESEVLTEMLNNYLSLMSNIAIKHGGTIDKYIGDAIMIFFGDPESRGVKQDALSCILMAIEMQNELKSLYAKWAEEGIPEAMKIRIGINSGFCTVGNFGSHYRMEYTIIGGQVNLASRLQAIGKPGEIVISEDTYLLIKNNFICEKGEIVHLKGIGHAVQTYKVLEVLKVLEEKPV